MIVLFDREGRVLLLKRADVGRDKSLRGKWGFPGGKVEPGETPLDAVTRECCEETGFSEDRYDLLDKDPVRLSFPPYRIYAWDAYLRQTAPVILSSEHTDHRWLLPATAYDDLKGQHAGPGTEWLLRGMGVHCYSCASFGEATHMCWNGSHGKRSHTWRKCDHWLLNPHHKQAEGCFAFATTG